MAALCSARVCVKCVVPSSPVTKYTQSLGAGFATACNELAETLLQRELELTGVAARDALARALRLVPDEEPVTVRLAPDDHDILVADEVALAAGTRTVHLIADVNGYFR